MRTIISLCCAGLLGALAACSQHPSVQYQRAEEIPPLSFPDGKSSANIVDLYAIPELPGAGYTQLADEFVVPRPAPLNAEAEGIVKIQRLGEESWIYVTASPSVIWPRVQSFLQLNSVAVTHLSPADGVIDTAWFNLVVEDEQKTAPEMQDRFRIRIEPGVAANSAEIYLLQQGVAKAKEGQPWPPSSTHPQREQFVLKRLANWLATQAEQQSVSLLAQRIGAGPKVTLQTPESGAPYLAMRLSFARAWGTVEKALGHESFKLLQEDEAAGTFQFEHYPSGAPEKPGFFARMLGRGDSPKGENLYRLKLQKVGDNKVFLYLYNADDQRLKGAKARDLLQQIFTHMG